MTGAALIFSNSVYSSLHPIKTVIVHMRESTPLAASLVLLLSFGLVFALNRRMLTTRSADATLIRARETS